MPMFYPLSWNRFAEKTHQFSRHISESAQSFDCIVAIAKGGLTIAHLMGNDLQLPVTSFTVSTYKHMQQVDTPELQFAVAPEVAGKNILVVDDIADSGETLLFADRYLKNLPHGAPASIKTATLFLKPSCKVTPDFWLEEVTQWVIFPFELKETLETYQQMKVSDPEKALQLEKALEVVNS